MHGLLGIACLGFRQLSCLYLFNHQCNNLCAPGGVFNFFNARRHRYAEGRKGSDTAEVAPVTKTSRQYTSSSSKSNAKGAANALLDETVDV